MKYILRVTILVLAYSSVLQAQEKSNTVVNTSDDLYWGDATESYLGRPLDIDASKIFFIETNSEDFANSIKVSTFQLTPKAINSKFKSIMTKKYPYKFEIFTNDFKTRGYDFFISKGFKYRVFIQNYLKITRDFNRLNPSASIYKGYRFILEDINTGVKYGIGNMNEQFGKSIKEFIKRATGDKYKYEPKSVELLKKKLEQENGKSNKNDKTLEWGNGPR